MQRIDGSENSKIKGIMFDMDNTLFDLVEAKIASCDAIVANIGTGNAEELLMYFLRNMHNFESTENIRDYLVDLNVYSDEVYENCSTIYDDTKIGSIKLYPHVKETLEMLRKMKFRLFIVTDASHRNATKRLGKLELMEMFDHVITADVTKTSKPDINVFYHALSSVELKAEEVLFVGDSLRRDIEPANQVGMVTAYASYGDRNINESCQAKADYILNSIKDIFSVKGIGQQ